MPTLSKRPDTIVLVPKYQPFVPPICLIGAKTCEGGASRTVVRVSTF